MSIFLKTLSRYQKYSIYISLQNIFYLFNNLKKYGIFQTILEVYGMATKKRWIQSAIKKPGALHKQLGIPKGEKIPAATLNKAAKAPGKLGQRARLAKTLKRMK